MSKIICDVCGSRYPDTSAQCPICGSINSKAAKGAEKPQEDVVKTDLPERVSTPGGRFSKSNVSKRNEGKVFTEEPATRVKREKPQVKPQIPEEYDLEEEFEVRKNRQIYWDDVAMFCHFEEYELGIRPMDQGDVMEIDGLDELIEADPSYAAFAKGMN